MEHEQDPRVYFAAERTLLAWIRTGLALMGFGFVVARFGLFIREIALVRDVAVSHGSGSMYAGVAMVFAGAVANLYAVIEHRRFLRAYREGIPPAPTHAFAVGVAVFLSLAAVFMTAMLLID